MALFDRIYRLCIGENGKDGIAFEGKEKSTGLDISFDISKDLTDKTNKSTVKIYNLADSTLKKIEKEDTVCTLEVGYAQDIGLRRVFVGNVITCKTSYKNGDRETVLELADGQKAIRDSVVSLSYGEGVSVKKAIDDVASDMGLIVKYGNGCEFSTFFQGFSFIGAGRTCLDKVCAISSLSWSIQDNMLQVIKTGNTNGTNYALVFKADTGLIGFPEKIVKAPKKASSGSKKSSKKTETKEKKAGWKITTLLQPTLMPGDAIRLESKLVSGWFRIETMKHSGDYSGNNWYTEMEIYEVKEI